MSNNSIVEYKEITGQGLVFPFELKDGKGVISSGEDLIKSSVRNIIAFEYGERYFLYEFGLSIRSSLEEPNDDILKTILEHRFQTQIPKWDRRIRIVNLELIRPNDTTLNIHLELGIVGSNISQTFVFPYYKEIIY